MDFIKRPFPNFKFLDRQVQATKCQAHGMDVQPRHRRVCMGTEETSNGTYR